MAALHYVTNVSLDGFIEDAHGSLDWAGADDEFLTFITDLIRPFGTYLYGRRLYESMAVWETDPTLATQSDRNADFAAVWQAADKVVYSATLDAVPTATTRLERSFNPIAVRSLKGAAPSDLMIGGAALATSAFEADLVDEYHLFVHPVIVGAGKPALGPHIRVSLELLDEHRFRSGLTFLRYGVQKR